MEGKKGWGNKTARFKRKRELEERRKSWRRDRGNKVILSELLVGNESDKRDSVGMLTPEGQKKKVKKSRGA